MRLHRFAFLSLACALTLPAHAGWFDSLFQPVASAPVYVQATGAHFRSAPSQQGYSSVFGTFSQNTPLSVIQTQNFGSEGTWAFVRAKDGREGWVNSHLLAKNQVQRAPASKPAAPQEAATPKPAAPAAPAKPEVKPDLKKAECTGNFSKASEFFHDTQKGANLASLGSFQGKFGKVSPTFQISKSGNGLFLNMQLPVASVNVNVPISVCKTPAGGLYVNVDSTKARDATTNQPDQTVQSALENKMIPQRLKINVERSGNQIVFSGNSGTDTFSASAAVR
jgi:SH3-like domain-containing protein